MKKTLIALMALAGVAMGAEELWTIDMTKANGADGRITIAEGATYSAAYWSNGAISTDGTTITSDQKIALNDTNGNLGFRLKDEFSLTLDAIIQTPVSTQTSGNSPISVLMQIGEGKGWNFTVGVNSDNQFVFNSTGYSLTQGDAAQNGTLTGGKHTFTLTFGNSTTLREFNNGGNLITRYDADIKLYVDGVLAASAVMAGTNRPGDAVMNTLIVGNIFQEHAGIAGTYSSITAYSGVVSVPEPTTATLSLLALAGLAARRRRR